MIKLYFTNETREKISSSFFNKVGGGTCEILKNKIKKLLGGQNGILGLVLVNNKKIKFINRKYRGEKEATDVISFAYLEVTNFKKAVGDIVIGDIFISVDTAKKQAKEKKHNLKQELKILFIHGFLHCLGFNHKTDKQEKEMEKWAKKILNKKL